MDVQTLVQKAWRAYRGKVASKTPGADTPKYNLVLDIANQKQEEWARDSKVHWKSLYESREVDDAIDISQSEYELADDFLYPAKAFVVVDTTGNSTEIDITKPQKSYGNDGKIYIAGRNPKKATFIGTINPTFDDGALFAVGYYMPAELVETDDEVSVDDPYWLVYAVAAELARNDPAKSDEFANLIGMANNLYQNMIDANDESGFMQDNTIDINMPQMGDQSDVVDAFE